MEAEIKRQKRSDPQVKEKEAEWKRIRCQDTLYKSKETIQNTHYKDKEHCNKVHTYGACKIVRMMLT